MGSGFSKKRKGLQPSPGRVGAEEGGGGKEMPLPGNEVQELCPIHSRQRLLFHCHQCHSDICLQCTRTEHAGHPFEDLTDTRAKVKDGLKDRLAVLTAEIQRIDHLVTAFEERSSKFQQEKQLTEQDVHARADTLHQWVNQSKDETISSIQSRSKQLTKPWQDQAEQLRNKKLALQAQHDHILQVLKDGKETGVVSLVAQLSANPMEDVKVKEMEKELTKDIPTLRVEHSTTAVNPLQVRSFIGVLEPVQQTSGPEDTPLPIQPTSVQGKTSGGVSVKGSDLRHKADSGISESSELVMLGRKTSKEFTYSWNPDSFVWYMCPISHNRLWVMWFTLFDDSPHLGLFDDDGQMLTKVHNPKQCDGLLAITDDVILCWTQGDSTVQLITPDGRQSSYDMGIMVGCFVSCAGNGGHYVIDIDTESLHSVKFALANTDHTGKAGAHSTPPHPKPPAPPSLSNQLTHSVSHAVSDVIPFHKCLRHASAGEEYFASISLGKVEVHAGAESGRSALHCSYHPKNVARDARFCVVDGQEMMVVTVLVDHKVHVVDHTDGGRLVGYLDTETLNLDRPCRLATDFDRHLWIGCDGGKVVVVDL